jgi:hypothetical protein
MNMLTQIPQKIGQVKSPLQEVSRQLARIGSSGSFATRLTVAAGDLDLEVQGVGRIRFPITPSTARRLCAVARPARHGYKDETRLDQRVRDTWEIAKSRISIDRARWMNTLAPQLDRICHGLGLPQGCRLQAQLHNMLVYAPGQFFAPHQDSEKTDDMIGTLVVSLPSHFTGGAVSIEHHGAKMRVGGSDKSLTFIAFYADCHHEVHAIKEGYRIVLTYNLVLEHNAPAAGAPTATINGLTDTIREFFATPGQSRWSGDHSIRSPPDRLVYLLDHEYTQRGLRWNRLKNSDAHRAVALQEVARELDCEIFLALADVHETWSCEDEYSGYFDYGQRYYGDDDDDAEGDENEGGESPDSSDPELTELIDSDVELRHWLGAGGRWEAVAARVDAAELCYTRASVDLEPFESEHEGYTGNAGNTVEHWYHRAAVVLWPRERTFVIRAKASPRWGIGEVAKSLRARNPAAAISMAQRLLPFWANATGRTEKPALFDATVKVAAKLGDPSVAAALLQPFALTALAPKAALRLTELLAAYGLDWCRTLVRNWRSEESHELPQSRLSWVEAALPILCRALCASDSSAGRELAGWILSEQWAWLLERSRQIRQHVSAKDVTREMVSLCKPILRVIESSRATQQPDLLDRVIAFLTTDAAELPVQVPIGLLRNAKEHHAPTTLRNWGLRPVHAHCLQVATARLNEPTRASTDWSIRTLIRCSCRLCETLTQFLRASDKVRYEWKLAKDHRSHIHRIIDAYDLPVTHTTRRKGSPFTLVLTKTAAVFERDAAERQSWQQELQWLKKTTANF